MADAGDSEPASLARRLNLTIPASRLPCWPRVHGEAMLQLFRNLEAWGTSHALGLTAVGAAVAMMLVLGVQGAPLRNDVAESGIVSLELARNAAWAERLIESWGAALHDRAVWQVILDFPFILAYAWALFYFGVWAWRQAVANTRPKLAIAAHAAAWAGLAAGALDIFEDAGLLAMLGGARGNVVAGFTSACAIGKFALLAGAAITATLAAGLSQPVAAAPADLSWGSMRRTARAAIGVLLLAGLALLLPPQTRDMLAGLSGEEGRGIWAGVAFHLALWLMAFCAWHWSRAVLSARFAVPDRRAARAAPPAGAGGGTVDPKALDWMPRLIFAAAASIGIVAAMRSNAWLQVLVIVGWLVPSLVLLSFRLVIQQFFGREDRTYAGAIALADPGAAVGGWFAPVWRLPLIRHAPLGPWIGAGMLFFAIGLFLEGAIWTFWPEPSGLLAPYMLGRLFPGPAAALFCLGLAIGPLTWLTYRTDGIRFAWPYFGVLWSLRRPPIFLLLLLWVLIMPTLFNLHALRVVRSEPGTVAFDQRKPLDALFKEWAETCQKGQIKLRPVIVAVSGGASRAGMWGARVLSEIDAMAAAGGTPVFAVSSVSGGSLGAAAYVAAVTAQGSAACALKDENRKAFYDAAIDAVGRDALGPVLAGSLFGDVPRAALALPAWMIRRAYHAIDGTPDAVWRGGDRAEALERAFEQNWSEAVVGQFKAWERKDQDAARFSRPFLSLAYDPANAAKTRGAPIWIANGTDQQNGVRVLTVPFDYSAWPFLGAVDALALLKGDVPVSTAIHNTARFPFLSPAGELTPVSRDKDDHSNATQLIDGGYFENEGLLTAWELARYLKDNAVRIMGAGYEIDPILVQASADAEKDIDENRIIRCSSRPDIKAGAHDGPGQSLGRSRPMQALAPLLGLYNVRGGHSDWILREVRQEYCDGDREHQRFYHFYLYRIDEDVPLNWVLSRQISCKIWNAVWQDVKGGVNPNLPEVEALARLLGVPQQSWGGRSMAAPRQVCQTAAGVS
jgi:hypothetical protein